MVRALFLSILAVLAFVPAVDAAPVIVSVEFDDAFSVHADAAQILEQHGLRGVFYVNSSRFDTPGYLTVDQARQMQAAGHQIGGHTLSHPRLSTLPEIEQRREICEDRSALLALGLQARDFAYPFGDQNALTRAIVEDCGYTTGRGVSGLRSPGQCIGCAFAESIPPASLFALRIPQSVRTTTSVEYVQQTITDAAAAGGGWVQILMHNVCDGTGCGEYSITPADLDRLAEWLAAQPGLSVQTLDQVVPGVPQPPVAAPPRPAPSRADNVLTNPSLEDGGAETPDCWKPVRYQSTDGVWSSTTDARSGGFAQRLEVSTLAAGGANRLIVKQDNGLCAPSVFPGVRYEVSAWVKSTEPVRLTAYRRNAAGRWLSFGSGPAVAADGATGWRKLTWTTAATPADTTSLSVTLSAYAVGPVIVDDLGLRAVDPPAVALGLNKCRGTSIAIDGVPLAAAWRSGFLANYCAPFAAAGKDVLITEGGVAAARHAIGLGQSRDAATPIAVTDMPPTAAEHAAAESGDPLQPADDAQLRTIPAGSEAIALIVNYPDGCTIPAAHRQQRTGLPAGTARLKLTRTRLEHVWAGDTAWNTWGELVTGIDDDNAADQDPSANACAGLPVTRVVRPDASGQTRQFKHWLWLSRTTRAWREEDGVYGNTDWPRPLEGLVTGAADGADALAEAVAVTDGAIGYVDVGAARRAGFDKDDDANDTTFWIPVINRNAHLVEPTFSSTAFLTETAHQMYFGKPVKRAANCRTTEYRSVPDAGADGTATASDTLLDWSAVTGVHLLSSASASDNGYGLCALLYANVWDDTADAFPGSPEGLQRTVRDYLFYGLSSTGQTAAELADHGRAPEPMLAGISRPAQGLLGYSKP